MYIAVVTDSKFQLLLCCCPDEIYSLPEDLFHCPDDFFFSLSIFAFSSDVSELFVKKNVYCYWRNVSI